MVALPVTCPPGVSRRKWERWTATQRRAALREYWSSLPEATKAALEKKYGQAVSRTARRSIFALRREDGVVRRV